MIIDCISDLHGHLPSLAGGDMLIIAGDITASDRVDQWCKFFKWFYEQKYEKKILVGGNHDGFLQQCCSSKECKEIRDQFDPDQEDEDFSGDEWYEYLCDSGTEFQGLKIWGSPWTPAFMDWHFMKHTPDELRQVWDLIPEDTNILITHGPPYGVLDYVKYSSRGDHLRHAGCYELTKAIDRIKPGLHVFGHIHEQGGQHLVYKHTGPNTLCINAAIMNEHYEPVNKPIRVFYGINPMGNCLWDVGFKINDL